MLLLNDILHEYNHDIKIDLTNLERELAKINLLHAKYMSYWDEARSQYQSLNNQLQRLTLAKWEHYKNGASKETRDKGWKIPNAKILLKDLPLYLNADDDLIELKNKADNAEALLERLKDMMDSFKYRNRLLEAIINNRKFLAGD